MQCWWLRLKLEEGADFYQECWKNLPRMANQTLNHILKSIQSKLQKSKDSHWKFLGLCSEFFFLPHLFHVNICIIDRTCWPAQNLKIYGDFLGKHILSDRFDGKVLSVKKTTYRFTKIVPVSSFKVKVDA